MCYSLFMLSKYWVIECLCGSRPDLWKTPFRRELPHDFEFYEAKHRQGRPIDWRDTLRRVTSVRRNLVQGKSVPHHCWRLAPVLYAVAFDDDHLVLGSKEGILYRYQKNKYGDVSNYHQKNNLNSITILTVCLIFC